MTSTQMKYMYNRFDSSPLFWERNINGLNISIWYRYQPMVISWCFFPTWMKTSYPHLLCHLFFLLFLIGCPRGVTCFSSLLTFSWPSKEIYFSVWLCVCKQFSLFSYSFFSINSFKKLITPQSSSSFLVNVVLYFLSLFLGCRADHHF